MRLAIFCDQIFWRDGHVLSTDESYILFLTGLADFVDEMTIIGRQASKPGCAPYVLERSSLSLIPLPFYPDLYQLWRADRRKFGDVRRAIRQQAHAWDLIIINGPNPIGQLIARDCMALGIPVVLLVRENFIQHVSAQRGLKRWAALLAAWTLDWDFKRMARGRAVLAVGTEMTDKYRRITNRVLNHFACLVDEAQFEMFSRMSVGSDPTRLICICRLAPEKGHLFLFEALAELRKRGVVCHLDLVGTGAMEQELRAKVAKLGLQSQVTFHGYVPYGPALFDLYQQAGAFVLASTTEGFPQVINEALSMGLPTVATTVGGIPSFLTDGETAMLVPPRDVQSLAAAIERLVRDDTLRERLQRNGRALMRDNTLEVNRGRLLEALRNEVARSKARVPFCA
jgi:glycosyltransferase involved in cell wall biosynthesis